MTNEHLHNNVTRSDYHSTNSRYIDIIDMATSRPTSMIIPPGVFDESNINGSKTLLQKKDSQSTRSTNAQTTLPVNNHIFNAHSSSSSLDSAGARHANSNEKSPLEPIHSMTTISSTTTDSDLESEQEEIYTDDNPFSESSNQLTKHNLTKCDSQSSKTHDIQRSSRRVKHFQKLFKSEFGENMPELIDSYVCAYQGDILLQGKMYITDRFLCFHSRIISYVTKHVYRWEQIENVTKERVAFIFPTAIGIQLKSTGKRIIYASFLQRDQAFEKILSICSRFGGHECSSPYQDDDETQYSMNGTIRSNNSNLRNSNEKIKKHKRNLVVGIPDEVEQDEVLQMCLRQDKQNTTTKRTNHSSKNHNDKQLTKKLIYSDKKKSSNKTSNIDSIVSSHLHETNLDHSHSRSNTPDQNKPIDNILINSSLRITRTDERRSSRSNSPSYLMTNSEQSMNQFSRLLTFLIKFLLKYFTIIYHQWQTSPIKMSIILLIFIVILILHSFYLIQLAYRIENRLHSLHPKWTPSSSSSSNSMKTSLPSFEEF